MVKERRVTSAASRVGPAVLLLLALAAAACSSSQPARRPLATGPAVPVAPRAAALSLIPARFADLPGWTSDQHAEGLLALQRSCAKMTGRWSEEWFGGNELFGRVAHWQRICDAAYRVGFDDRAARRFFEGNFQPYRAINGSTDLGLFTGYYEPVLRGSWYPYGPYTVPIYRLPPEAALANGRAVPMPSRAQIETGALSGRGLELLWVDDPADAFFLHIQGSGQVEMTDGSRVRVGFAGKNGHSYFPIGAELVRLGEVPQERMSMQAIRSWLATHPRQAPGLMALNGSYVFFRLIDGEGPIGAQGVPLMPGRSMAVDPSYVPYGVPLWIDTTDPIITGAPLRRLVVAQDTGGAIKGPIRGDLFWGSGEHAGASAGLMRQPGRWFLLLPKAAIATS
jgi:membrane-bound lytic murein transglycosylase A